MDEPMKLRLIACSGATVRTVAEHDVATVSEAWQLVETHATTNGMTNVKMLDEQDGYSWRFTATTPGGRPGRNIAFLN